MGSIPTTVKALLEKGVTHILASSGRSVCHRAKLVRLMVLTRAENGMLRSPMSIHFGILRLLIAASASPQHLKQKVSACALILGHECHPINEANLDAGMLLC